MIESELKFQSQCYFCATLCISCLCCIICVCVDLQVVFFPSAAERSSQVFTIVCDNCQVKDISIEGKSLLTFLQIRDGFKFSITWFNILLWYMCVVQVKAS